MPAVGLLRRVPGMSGSCSWVPGILMVGVFLTGTSPPLSAVLRSQFYSWRCSTTHSLFLPSFATACAPGKHGGLPLAPNKNPHFSTPTHLLILFPLIGIYYISTPSSKYSFPLALLMAQFKGHDFWKPLLNLSDRSFLCSPIPVFSLSYYIVPYIFFLIYKIGICIHSP